MLSTCFAAENFIENQQRGKLLFERKLFIQVIRCLGRSKERVRGREIQTLESLQFISNLTNSSVWWMRLKIATKLYWFFPFHFRIIFANKISYFSGRKKDGKQCYNTMETTVRRMSVFQGKTSLRDKQNKKLVANVK